MSAPPAQRAARRPAAPGRVQLIAGRYRRTVLAVPDLPGLRPTPERVRGTLFNWLVHLRGGLEGLHALDLFAGSGALGLEAASRGAAGVVLVESAHTAAAALRRSCARLEAAPVRVLEADWRGALARLAAERFDLVFLDPPFGGGQLAPALQAVQPCLAPGALVYAESGNPQDFGAAGYEAVREGRAGAVHFHLLRQQGS
jgi:16S rRNA (guanine(966)-N(2))-methyltransferase RsmD